MDYRDFKEYGVDERILNAVAEMGFVTPTPVQEKTIPLAMSGVDLLVQAPTGTGKTAAFGVPIVNAIDLQNKTIQALVLCPTRELTMQITAELKHIAAKKNGVLIVSVYGGQNIDRQFAAIRRKPHIIVGTTGRIMDHLRRGTLKIDGVRSVVLDEADEMLDMGFREDIDFILAKLTEKAQTMLFSATMPKAIAEISASYQTDPILVKTTCKGNETPPIKQYVVRVKEENKYDAFKKIFMEKNYKNVLVFCNTKRRASELNKKLSADYFLSLVLHGDLRQRERDKVMKTFRAHEVNILVATDVAARGIDVEGIEAIFNYDIPMNEEFYVHRIGRTARAERNGVAYTFCNGRDKAKLADCEKAVKTSMEEVVLDGISESVGGKRKYAVPTVRFFVNVGEKDGANKERMLKFLLTEAEIGENDVYDVHFKDIYGFVETDARFSAALLTLNGKKCFGRKLVVEESAALGEKKGKNADKPQAEKRNTSERGHGDRKFATEKKTYAKKKGYEEKSEEWEKKPSAEKKAYGDKKVVGEKKTYGDKKVVGEKKAYGDKKFSGEKKAYGDKKVVGEKKAYGDKKPIVEKKYGAEAKPTGERAQRRTKKPSVGKSGFDTPMRKASVKPTKV